MLNLAVPTDERWITVAIQGLDEVLLDHAHCEKKAAGMAVQLLFRYPQHAFIQEPLSQLAREELEHFEQVLRHLERRGVAFAAQRPSSYAGRLRGEIRPAEPARLIDILLCNALIEARSCERFQLLAGAVTTSDPELAKFYGELLACEARHHQVYAELATGLASETEVRERLAELAKHEAKLVSGGTPTPRMHG